MSEHDAADSGKSVTNRRRVLKLTGATGVMGLSGLAGCTGDGGSGGGGGGDGGSGGDSGGGEEDAVEIIFWHTEPQEDRVSFFDEAIAAFENQYDTPVTVTQKGVDQEEINQQVLAGAASDTLPNVVMPNVQMVQQLGAEGLLSADAAGNAIDQVGRDRFHNGPLNFMSDGDGGHFGVPHNTFVNTFWWRKSAFDEVGASEPNTWDALRESAEALHDPDNTQFGIGLGTDKSVFTRECFITFALSNGARVVNKDGDVVFDTPEMVEALEFYAELAALNPPGKHAFDELRNLYLSENLDNTMWSSYILDDILNEGGQEMVDDTGIVATINKEEEVMGGFVKGLGILNAENNNISERHVEVATDFVSFLYEDDWYIPFLHLDVGGFRPVLNDITGNEAYQDHEVIDAWGDELQRIDDGINSDGFGQFGIVDGEVIPEFGKAAGELLVAEAIVRVIDGEDAETVASEQATKIEEAMYS